MRRLLPYIGGVVAGSLMGLGSAPEEGAIVSPTERDVILIRRPSPDAVRFAAVAEAGKADACGTEPFSS